jgi:ribose 1,5-bisphosphokinase PhnN
LSRDLISGFSCWQEEQPVRRRGLVVIGASGSGKSYLLALLRQALSNFPEIEFPIRLTTRPARSDDSPLENRTVNIAELDALSSADRVFMRWEKRIEPNRRESYAFLRSNVPFVILGGNDELISNRASVQPDPDVLDELLKIAVVCDARVRAERLLRRSPQLNANPDELKTRLSSTPSEVLDVCDFVLDNTDGFVETDVARIKEFALYPSDERTV